MGAICLTGILLAHASALQAGSEVIVDQQTKAMITPPEGIVVTHGGGIPEWDFNPAPGAMGWPSLGRNNLFLCVLSLSVSADYTHTYLKETVDSFMRGQNAGGAPSVVTSSSEKIFVMTSVWTMTKGEDAGNVIFMYHAQTTSSFAYMSCTTRADEALTAKPLFRRIWDSVKIPD